MDNKLDVLADEPIKTIDIVLAPLNSGTVNRLQFHNRSASQMCRCTVKFKKNVKHLQLVNELDAVEQEVTYHDYFHDDDDETNLSHYATYEGEGFSQPGIVNNAIGFFKNGKMYILPIQESYDMQHLLHDKKVEEMPTVDESKLSETNLLNGAVPVHAKFGRQESEMKKKRREQSSQHKQKLIDQDPWVPLNVRRRQPIELVESTIKKMEKVEDKKIKVEQESL